MTRNTKSLVRGIMAIRLPYAEPKPRWGLWRARGWWAEWWTPTWHEGRGPYITVGLGLCAFGRGY